MPLVPSGSPLKATVDAVIPSDAGCAEPRFAIPAPSIEASLSSMRLCTMSAEAGAPSGTLASPPPRAASPLVSRTHFSVRSPALRMSPPSPEPALPPVIVTSAICALTPGATRNTRDPSPAMKVVRVHQPVMWTSSDSVSSPFEIGWTPAPKKISSRPGSLFAVSTAARRFVAVSCGPMRDLVPSVARIAAVASRLVDTLGRPLENRPVDREAVPDGLEHQGQLCGDVLLRVDVPVQSVVRPRRDLRLLPGDARV